MAATLDESVLACFDEQFRSTLVKAWNTVSLHHPRPETDRMTQCLLSLLGVLRDRPVELRYVAVCETRYHVCFFEPQSQGHGHVYQGEDSPSDWRWTEPKPTRHKRVGESSCQEPTPTHQGDIHVETVLEAADAACDDLM